MSISYSLSNLPSDGVLADDLQAAVAAYKALTFRGGLDPIAEKSDDDAPGETASLIEQRRYKMHRRTERNPKAAKEAKNITALSARLVSSSSTNGTGRSGVASLKLTT